MPASALTPQPITDQLLRELAAQYGFEPAALRAILAVETGGAGFDPKTGKVLIQFEPAWFKKLLPKAKLATVERDHPQEWALVLANPVGSQPVERTAFNAAWVIDPTTAMLATSFGISQVMGFNFATMGYPSVNAMVDAFRQGGEAEQVRGMCRFIASRPKMLAALRARQWATVAYYYNGSGYTRNQYDVKLQAAHAKWAPHFA